MKTIMGAAPSARALVSLLALAMPFGISGTARADGESQVCGPQTLLGSYVFTAQGFNIVSGVAVPKAIVEGIDFNGDGTLSSPFATVSINGVIIRSSGSVGTYTVAARLYRELLRLPTVRALTHTCELCGSAALDDSDRCPVPAVFEGMVMRVSR